MTTKPTQCAQGYDCDACKGIEGMTLRDWFAGMAMSGMMHEGFIPHEFDKSEGFNYPSAAYQMADALLANRNSYTKKEFWVEVSASGSPLSVSVVKPSDHGVNCIKVREVVE